MPMRPPPMAAPRAARPMWMLPLIPAAALARTGTMLIVMCGWLVWFLVRPRRLPTVRRPKVESLVVPALGVRLVAVRADEQGKDGRQQHEDERLHEPDEQLHEVERNRDQPA